MEDTLEQLWACVRAIPKGRVASYGEVGRALDTPASGYQVGRWMARAPDSLPWWRVVGKEGDLRTNKRDPRLAEAQRRLLTDEGVPFEGARVRMDQCEHRF